LLHIQLLTRVSNIDATSLWIARKVERHIEDAFDELVKLMHDQDIQE
jgi:hypothetical protein